jgi:hypothetical protein
MASIGALGTRFGRWLPTNVTECGLALYLAAKVGYPGVLPERGVTLLPHSASNDRPGGHAQRGAPANARNTDAQVDKRRFAAAAVKRDYIS